jgi:hypothetical protein
MLAIFYFLFNPVCPLTHCRAQILAGAEGFEPPSPVLETGSLTVELTPLPSLSSSGDLPLSPKDLGAPRILLRNPAPKARKFAPPLFHFLMRRVLAATAAEFLELQPLRRRLLVLRGRVVPLFALATLQRHNFSGHFNNSWLYASSLNPVILSNALSALRRT